MAFIEMDFASGGGGSKLETYAELEIKATDSALSGKNIDIVFEEAEMYPIPSTKFSTTTDGTYYTASAKVQSFGTYYINADGAPSVPKKVNTFRTPIEVIISTTPMELIPPMLDSLVALTDKVGGAYATATMDYSGQDYSGSGTYKAHNSGGYAYGDVNKFFDGNGSTGNIFAKDGTLSILLPNKVKLSSARVVCGTNNPSYPVTNISMYVSTDGGNSKDLIKSIIPTSAEGSTTTEYIFNFTAIEDINWVGFTFDAKSLPNPYEIQLYGFKM